MLGSQGLEDANVPFEESVRVPLLIRYPRELKAGVQREDILVSNVDLMPTLLSLCGVPVPRDVQGKDLSFALMHGQAGGQESVFAEGKLGAPDEWRMLVRGLDKLVVDSNLEVTHLFNLGQDPFELENLAREISQELKRNELKALLNDWMRRTGDRVDTSGLKKRT
jgi:arylsulfatase A-like enzyme